MSMKIVVQPPQPTHIVCDGVSNFSGLLTNVVTEKTLTPGLWLISATVPLSYQTNHSSGAGLGASPCYAHPGQWCPIFVKFGETKYVVFKKYPGSLDGFYAIDRSAVVYP